MGRPTLEEEKSWFLKKLEELGGTAGNGRLQRFLGTNWGDDRYWATHKRLLDEGLIARGRGQGGSVLLVERSGDAVPVELAAYKQAPPIREHALYADCRSIIEAKWINERGFDQAIVEITAARRSAATGIWMQPDITALVTKTYPYLPGRTFEIITFEVKKQDAIDVRGLFEALSHRQFATLAYVIFYTGDQQFDTEGKNIARVRELARGHGVGVIVASSMRNYETWEELIEPRRNFYDPEVANSFVAKSFSESAKHKVVQWQK